MRNIKFKWSGHVHSGYIVNQCPSDIQGQKTLVRVTHIDDSPFSMNVTMYGRCDIGNCGPFTVISIDNAIQ